MTCSDVATQHHKKRLGETSAGDMKLVVRVKLNEVVADWHDRVLNSLEDYLGSLSIECVLATNLQRQDNAR